MESNLIPPNAKQFTLPFKYINEIKSNVKILDVGANGGLPMNFSENITYTTLDIEKNPDIKHNLDKFPFPIEDNQYDIIICLETLEHSLYPHKVMKELIRISKPNAIFLVSMPNEYNFWCRINFLFGRKTMVQEPFRVVEKHLHIQLPRVKDIIEFYSEYLDVEEMDYQWYSNLSGTNNNFFLKFIDWSINKLAKVLPSLFTRTVVIRGRSK